MIERRSDGPLWRRIALPSSLVLNLFLLALVGGHLLRRDMGPGGPPAVTLAQALAKAEATLSPADAQVFGGEIRGAAPRYAGAAMRLEEARTALGRQITSEPYDPAAVHRAFTAWQASWNEFISSISDTLVDALGRISPDGRKRLIDLRRQRAGVTP